MPVLQHTRDSSYFARRAVSCLLAAVEPTFDLLRLRSGSPSAP